VFAVDQVKKTKVFDYIDYLVFSFDVGVIKPDKKIYLRMLELARVQPHEALMIGDKPGDDVIPPKKIGMHAIQFKNYNQLKRDLKELSINL